MSQSGSTGARRRKAQQLGFDSAASQEALVKVLAAAGWELSPVRGEVAPGTELLLCRYPQAARLPAAQAFRRLGALVLVLGDDEVPASEHWMHFDGQLSLQADEATAAGELAAAVARAQGRRRDALLTATEAVGQIAGGVAHDINNLLTPLLGNLELLQMSTLDAGLRDHVDEALAAAERGVASTRRLGNFSNRGSEGKFTELNHLITDLCRRFEEELPEGFELRHTHSNEEILVSIDALRIRKALVNLLDNACEAMPGGGCIQLEVSPKPLNLERPGMQPPPWGMPQRYAVISVIDSGEGMSPEVLAQARNLFFSTRQRGRAAGLGLSIADAFCQAEGGAIVLQSEPGAGTRVHCCLPLPDSETIVMDDSLAAADGASEAPKLNVLLVDDDPMVSSTTAAMLKALGHDVVSIDNGYEALRIVNRKRDFDLVISDVQMPGEYGGIELAGLMQEAFPRLPVLLMSGSDAARSHRATANMPTLDKPFSMQQLSDAIRKLCAD